MSRKLTHTVVAGCLALAGALAASAAAQPASPVGADAESTTEIGGSAGEQIYRTVCAACHMPDARGATGAGFYPTLAGNARLRSGAYPVYVVMNGLNGMPPLGEDMTDEQVADVVNYVRTHFGNDYRDSVQPADVSALR